MNTVASLPERLIAMAESDMIPMEEAAALMEEAAAALTTPEQPGSAVQGEAVEHVRKQVGRLAQWLHCMSHNESYFGEPAGLVKSVTEELAHAVDPIYPPIVPPPDPLAGVTIRTATVPFTTPPPAPAAEQGQPEARGVEELRNALEHAEGKLAELVEAGAGKGDSELTCMTLPMIRRILATPNPVRAEQPEGKGADDLLRRIDAAIERITSGRGGMRIPADNTDPDLVLADAGNWIKNAAAPAAPVGVDEDAVFRLAAWMAKHDGHEDPHHLIWEGSPPEPWGEVWNRYEDDARAALAAALAGKDSAHKAQEESSG